MKRLLLSSSRIIFIALLVTLTGLASWGLVNNANASGLISRLFAGSPPTIISYQGAVQIAGAAYTGTGYFKFAVVDSVTGDGSHNYWANDGLAIGEPAAAVALAVSNGIFTVMLGDTTLSGMTETLDGNVFSETNTFLRVWFSQNANGPFEALEPNQRIASVPYALRAKYADNAPSGPVGPEGATGPTGAQGETGPSGPQGPAGATGAQGQTGSSGPQGASGPTGPQGLTGSTGPSGPSGPSGPNPLSGVTCSAGQILQWDGTAWICVNKIQVSANTAACDSSLQGALRYNNRLEVCSGGVWLVVVVEREMVLYTLSNLHDGNLGGRSGGDALCAASTNKPSGYDNYRAFISVNADDEIRDMPSNYGVSTSARIVSKNGTIVADNWADLMDGSIDNSLSSAGITYNAQWWSGSNADGSIVTDLNCSAWTSSGTGDYGRTGNSNSTDDTWISYSSTYKCAHTTAVEVFCLAY